MKTTKKTNKKKIIPMTIYWILDGLEQYCILLRGNMLYESLKEELYKYSFQPTFCFSSSFKDNIIRNPDIEEYLKGKEIIRSKKIKYRFGDKVRGSKQDYRIKQIPIGLWGLIVREEKEFYTKQEEIMVNRVAIRGEDKSIVYKQDLNNRYDETISIEEQNILS